MKKLNFNLSNTYLIIQKRIIKYVLLRLKLTNSSTSPTKDLVKKYCSVFTPNEKIEF